MTSNVAGSRRKPPHLPPHWTATEDDFARRFALALVRGQYAGALDAARACRVEFHRKTGRWIHHHLAGIHFRIGSYARQLGRPPANVRWTRQEKQVVERFARAVVQGRYRSTLVAARECRRALDELATRGRTKSGRRVVRRSVVAIRGKLFPLVKALFGPRFGAYWMPAEDRIVDRHARALVGGRLPNATAAGRECHRELCGYAQRQRLRSPARLSACSLRTLAAANLRLRQRAYELGWGCFRRHPWTTKEREIALKWIRRYRSHLKVGTVGTLGDDARGMRAELRKHGFRRTLDQCKTRLWKLAHRQAGVRQAASSREPGRLI
jgi:hypothetical protein